MLNVKTCTIIRIPNVKELNYCYILKPGILIETECAVYCFSKCLIFRCIASLNFWNIYSRNIQMLTSYKIDLNLR